MHIIIPEDYADCVRHLDAFSRLKQGGHEVTIYTDAIKTEDEKVRRFAEADVLVLTRERTRITAGLLDRLPRLKMISQFGKVVGHVDLDACTERGIAVADGRGTARATVELAWALILAASRNLVGEANRLRDGRWHGTLGRQVHGRRLGIWGYGRIGKQVAEIGSAFGMQVWVWGREGSLARALADGMAAAPSREAFLAESDVVSLHVRLDASTVGLVTADDLARMKPDALLVNTSRAELVAPGALVEALRRGRPGKAAVDVYETEPVLDATHPLLDLPNALCTPHLGYLERDNYENYFGIAFDNIAAFVSGVPRNIVNPEYVRRARPLHD